MSEAAVRVRRAQAEDYPQILALQHANVRDNLSPAERRQGFIVSALDNAQLTRINQALGVLVAVQDDRVIGFVCLSPTHFTPRPPVVDTLLQVKNRHYFRNKPMSTQRLFLYGPVCVDHGWRGKGVLKQLYQGVQTFTRDRYDSGIAFIDNSNPHSLAAHVDGLGMTDIAGFTCNNRGYQMVAFAAG
ncbi:GNAT family N-acetyltransferase [Chimaeribacter arupi]|uniref:GNAT family N-acetyltransferase n=1 Tax=Chimaeribacter arupi TaxID=2060066 RepID=UPI000C7E190F|nr:GNAT family N-acetyltransferase [Chimaeribacter arupi]PLR39921.1 N-acetyltransferase [Chimaeribacter arupi]